MNDRDALAALIASEIQDQFNWDGFHEWTSQDACDASRDLTAASLADAILAAGWRLDVPRFPRPLPADDDG